MRTTLRLTLMLMIPAFLFGQETDPKKVFKQLPAAERQRLLQQEIDGMRVTVDDCDTGHDELRETIITGNQIRVLVTNQGSISTPAADNANADLVWPAGPQGLGYAYEFGPIIGAEVFDENGDTLHIISDGFFSDSGGEFEPGTTNRWGWEPRVGFSDPNSVELAHFSDLDTDLDSKPDSWPENWYNPVLGRYVWPAFLGDDATTPDEEIFYVMDDLCNAEFPYFPFPGDTTLRGLGLELQVRIFQFNNPLAEDIIFLVYTITNISPRRLDNVFLGMFGDPHIGGPNDFSDDNAGFISAFDEDFADRPNVRNMLYAWDNNGIGDGGKIPGYFGYRFLESPGIDDDGFDNDNDGLIDESQFNDAGTFEFNPDLGIFHWTGDEDGDWLEDFDDVGVDGFDNTGDIGEGDGKPTQLFYTDLDNNGILDPGEPTAQTRLPGMRFHGGEPNFGFLDIAESDQLGLTSFNAILFGGNNEPKNDELMWDLISTPNQRPDDPEPEIEQEADNVFIYGSGSFVLEPGESQRFSIALLLGEDFDDLLSNAEISQQVFESDYRFAQAPKKPTLVAVPGDEKVTLYWDSDAETSFDPFVARANIDDPSKGFDFEGYRLYRSQDYSFNDTKTITDSRGIPFLSEPHKQQNGLPTQWDLVNEFSGLSEIEYANRGVRFDMGNNSGLVHMFVDSVDVTNGVTYYYSVTSYDHGDINAQLPPSESQRTVQRNAVTREFSFDINTAEVVPGPPASGYIAPELDGMDPQMATRVEGVATGEVRLEFLDPLLVQDNKTYEIDFKRIAIDSGDTAMGYSLTDLQPTSSVFVARDTAWVSFGSCCAVLEGSVSVEELNGSSVGASRYLIDHETARIRGTGANDLQNGESFRVYYQVIPVNNSISVDGQDDNFTFDGIKLLVTNDQDELDPLHTEGGRSGWKIIEVDSDFSDEHTRIDIAGVGTAEPFPDDFEFHWNDYDTTDTGELVNPADSSLVAFGNVKTPFQIRRVSTGERVDCFISEAAGLLNKRWDWQEVVVIINPEGEELTETVYEVEFKPAPIDSVENDDGGYDYIYPDEVRYPGEGDVFLLFSKKSFQEGDKYSFTTKAASYSEEDGESLLDNVIVVPNPYIAYSATEISGVRTGDRDDREIQFRNLPPQCTIRIYTIVGEFVDRIDKDDDSSYASWDLLTFESQQVAYGVYIYHIDAPGIGTKIGRFAVIK